MTIQIVVKLPDKLANDLDRLVARGDFQNRSQAVREGLETILAAREQEKLRKHYREALARKNETPREMADAHRLAVASIEDETWERWW